MVEYGQLKDIMLWCSENLRGMWWVDEFKDTEDVIRYASIWKNFRNYYEFIFQHEEDMILFCLKWA